MELNIKENEKFIETVSMGEKVFSTQEGTFPELVQSEPKKKSPAAMRGAGPAEKADAAIKVAKFVWDIIKDSTAQAATDSACTRILSGHDENWQHYGEAKDFETKELTYKLNNFAGVNCYTVKFKVAGTCAAKNPEFGGMWIPNAHVTFAECYANFPWNISGKAKIDTTNISNIGTVEEPVPQVVLNITIKTDAKIAFNWESHEKTFEFKLNGKSGATLV